MMLRAQIIKKCPWVTLQGSRIVLVISYPATLKRDIIATVYDLRRSSSSNRSSKTSPLANPKSQTKQVICQCRQINSSVNLQFSTRV